MNLTDHYTAKLKRVKPKGTMDLKASECSMSTLRALYRAANKLGRKVSIRNTPDGMRLWRL